MWLFVNLVYGFVRVQVSALALENIYGVKTPQRQGLDSTIYATDFRVFLGSLYQPCRAVGSRVGRHYFHS